MKNKNLYNVEGENAAAKCCWRAFAMLLNAQERPERAEACARWLADHARNCEVCRTAEIERLRREVEEVRK